jgi:hypothetical protein
MSYFNTQFQGASMPITDAMRTRDFIARQKEQENQRREKSKQLAEDQKRLGMIAQGLGLEKGEVDSMSRGELQGFLDNEIRKKGEIDKIQNEQQALAKFNFDKQQAEIRNQIERTQANTNMLNAVNNNIQTNYNVNKNKFLDNKAQEESDATTKNQMSYQKFALNKVIDSKTPPDPTDPQSIKRFQEANDWVKKNPGAVEAVEAGQGHRAVSQFQGKGLTDADFIKNQTAPDALHPQSLKKLNDETAKDYADFSEEGGNLMMEKNIRSLRQVIAELDGSNKTGRPIDFFGQTLRSAYDAMTDGDSIAMQQKIDLITQANLKATLGAQFTENEAKMFLQRSYDPERTPKENVDKLRKELNLVIQMAESRRARFQYFEDNNYNMAGFMTKNPGALSSKGQGGNPGNPNSVNTQSGNKAKINLPATRIKRN